MIGPRPFSRSSTAFAFLGVQSLPRPRSWAGSRLLAPFLAGTLLAGSLLAGGLLAAACGPSPDTAKTAAGAAASIGDPHSFANPQAVTVRHLRLNLAVDFEKKILSGEAALELERLTDEPTLILDTAGLTIRGVTDGEGQDLPFELGKTELGETVHGLAALGQPLTIHLGPETEQVKIGYHTAPGAMALQWLEPSQTAGKEKPFLFTQSQPILARSWVPCQDTPQVRMTYEATVRVPPGLTALMSAANPVERSSDGIYHFHMDQPIPSYLLALAVGDLSFRPLGERSGVYAEPSVVEAAAWEFADLEAMMTAAEELYGPYRWERFDILVLPPSFPFGGMENPRLTFATPTLLAGDRSLVSTVAHELAHSWSGNLVTNATWNDLWLNEGFTVYFELRIMEELEGREYSEMLAQLGLQNLRRTVEELGPTSPLTRLHTELGSADDPDETFSDIPYEKGYFFLRLLEETVGRERFDDFLREYFDTFAFQSIDTAAFLNYLRLHLIEGDQVLEETLGIDGWVYGPGLPAGCPTVHATAFDAVDRELAQWTAGRPAGQLKTQGWNTHQWLYFLSQLPQDLTTSQLADLDLAFAFTQRGNAEILCAWLLHAIAHDYQPGLAAADEFLNRVGRRKFLEPLYKKLAETAAGRQLAREIYRRARGSYHPTAVAALDEILGWKEG